jgi:hypothetical protein
MNPWMHSIGRCTSRRIAYCPGGMAIEIVVNLPALFVIVDSVVAHNHS